MTLVDYLKTKEQAADIVKPKEQAADIGKARATLIARLRQGPLDAFELHFVLSDRGIPGDYHPAMLSLIKDGYVTERNGKIPCTYSLTLRYNIARFMGNVTPS